MSEEYNQHQYINLELSVPVEGEFQNIVIDQTNNQPILQEDISMYDIAVARMNLPTTSIPLFSLDENLLSTLLVEVSYGNQPSIRNIEYEPFNQFNRATIPNAVLYIDEFLLMVNRAIIRALDDLKLKPIPPPDVVSNTSAYFRIDNEAQRIELKYPRSWDLFDVRLRMSRTLHNLFFSGFPVRILSINDPEYQTRLPVQFIAYESIYTDVGDDFITLKSEYNTIPNFNKIHRIFLKTELPILDTLESSKNNDKTKLILDILPEQETPTRARILYAPTNYIFHDIVGSSPLYQLQFRVFVSFTTDPNNKYPILLLAGQTFTCKLILRKKER